MFYSQFGEDKILFDLFHRKIDGLCVEVGANNGVDDSTSLFFEQLGWKSILVEPNPQLCQNIRAVRKALLFECAVSNHRGTSTLYVVEGAERSHGLSTISTSKEAHDRIKEHGFVSSPVEVRTMTLDDVLTEAQVDRDIDFVSIDVEGHEHEVLEGFSLEKWRPSILLIEDNSNFEDDKVRNYLQKFDYVAFMRTGVNDWYAHRTNNQLANSKNAIRMLWLRLRIKANNRLRRSPLIVKFKSLLKRQISR